MTLARSQLISVTDTPYYHVICRCVRRAFLCGQDKVTKQSFEHRRQWVIDRTGLLSEVFTIDILAYAIMSNHYHLVVHIHSQQAIELTDQQVVERWGKLFSVPLLVRQYLHGESLNKADAKAAKAIINTWRERLTCLSWFMRCLNESIARKANQEDHCTGRFWEGRFKSQALLDDQAVIQCMCYVDLNPIRAGIAKSLASSDYTSVQQRIHALNQPQPKAMPLMPMSNNTQQALTVPCAFDAYLELLDWTSRAVIEHKKAISGSAPKIIEQLNLNPQQWLKHTAKTQYQFYRVKGAAHLIQKLAKKLKQRCFFGAKDNASLFG